MTSKRQVRRTATIVREELRHMEQALKRGDMTWAYIHAQQAAGFAANMEFEIESLINGQGTDR